MKFCSDCGSEVTLKIPDADNRKRYVCTSCDLVHYQNPRIIAGCIPQWESRVLICKRSIEPRIGLWTLPAGFMELGETTQQAALRETLEEANARVEVGELYTVISLPHVNQVHLMYRAQLLDLDFSPGDESEEVELVEPASIPWDRLAFATVRETLRFFVEDQRGGEFRPRHGDIIRSGEEFRFRAGAVSPAPGAAPGAAQSSD